MIESLEDGWAPRQRVYATAGEIKLVMETANGIITKEWVVGFVRALVCFSPRWFCGVDLEE